MAEILRCELTFAADDGPSESVIVKLPSGKSRSIGRLGRRWRLYRREFSFYRDLAPGSPLRAPALLYGDFDARTHRFVLVLEDLRNLTAADQVRGATPEQARRAVREVAGLHGKYWDRVAPLPADFHQTLAPWRLVGSPGLLPAEPAAQPVPPFRLVAGRGPGPGGGIRSPAGGPSRPSREGTADVRARRLPSRQHVLRRGTASRSSTGRTARSRTVSTTWPTSSREASRPKSAVRSKERRSSSITRSFAASAPGSSRSSAAGGSTARPCWVAWCCRSLLSRLAGREPGTATGTPGRRSQRARRRRSEGPGCRRPLAPASAVS